MKVLKRILYFTIWSLVALHVVVLLAVQLPPVQTWLGSKAGTALSEKLGTNVTVGRVELGLFNRIIINDVCIPDLQGDTLLRASHLSVKASLLPLLKGHIDISSAQLFGAHVRLYQEDSLSAPNWQFVVDAFSTDNDSTEPTPLDLHIGSVIVRHSSVSYDRGDAFTTPGRFNPAHIAINDISAHIMLKSLTPDSLSINLKRLSMHEKSGLSVENLNARIMAGPRAAQLYGLQLQLPHSTLAIDTLEATYALMEGTESDKQNSPQGKANTEDNRRHFLETLRYHANFDGIITPADLTPLIPSVHGNLQSPHSLSALPPLTLSASLSGTANSITLPDLNIFTSDGNLIVKASGILGPQKEWHLDIEQFEAYADMLATLEEAFPVIPDEISRLGNIHLTARAKQLPGGQADGQAAIATTLGDARLLFAIDSNDELSGQFVTDSLHLGRLLANDDLGPIAANITLGGTRQQLEAEAVISQLHFKGHRYSDIKGNCTYKPKGGDVAVHLYAPIMQLHPSGLGLTTERDDAFFSGTVEADVTIEGDIQSIQGHPKSLLDRAQGFVRIDDFTMRTATDSSLCHIDHLELASKNNDGEREIILTSDIANGELLGQFDLASLPNSLARYMESKLPTLPGLTSTSVKGDLQSPHSSNNFNLNLTVWDTQWMKPLLGIPLTLHQPLRLIAAIDDDDQTVNMSGRLPSFNYSGSRYRDCLVSITTLGDSTLCDATLTKMNDDGGQLTLVADIGAANNDILSLLSWRTTPALESDMQWATKGVLNTVTQLYTNANGKPEAKIGVLSSQVMVGDKPWHILPCRLTYSDNRLDVDSFVVRHNGQHLSIDGTASSSHADTLIVDMDGLDIAYIQDLLDFHPVDFSGLLGGKAKGTGVFGNFAAWADIVARDFRFMNGSMGTLLAQVKWNADDKQIDIDAVADEGGPRTVIQGYVSPVREDIDLKIRAEGSNIEFVHTFAESVMRNISGSAYGELELAGPLGEMNLTGELIADGEMTVDALNTTYRLEHDTVYFVPNDIQFRDAVIKDRDGNTATLSGGIHHEWLSDFTFDIDVETRNALVYDFPTFDDSNICGTVRATGHADMHGRPGEVIINCDVTPQAGSTFSYNAANPDAVSRQEFITWEAEPSKLGGWGAEQSLRSDSTTALAYNHSEPQPSNTGGSSDLIINFLINANPDATLRLLMDAKTGDYITLNGEGTIRASFHDKGPFHMFGTYTVSRGTYGITIQEIIKKNFTFQPEGTIIFGGDPYDAALNLQAVHTVNGVSLSDLNIGSSFASNTVRVNCLMNITGTPTQPHVEFDLEMPTVNSEEQQMIRSLIASEQEMNQQVLYLLGIGRFYTQGANNADAQQYGQTTLAMQSFLSGTVSTQINEVLSQVIKSNDWNFGANISTGDEGWNNAEYEGMVSGRLLNNRLLINGQFGYRDNATTTTPSFIGDFDLQYLLKQNGNLAVKVYNQTNDRYFTRSALNTQGVGLVMKKDFDGLSELLRRKKKVRSER
ncbi:MAG: translocation/assembly module TamB domain-containing protein [Prevotella sp.]|nr:translocation/assembly module TamB domain-containing protein [Prevotella sp.]